MLQLAGTHFSKALTFNTYRLHNQSQKYEGSISDMVAKCTKRVSVQIRPEDFKSSDPISVLDILHSFKTAGHSSSIPEEAAMQPFQDFMKDPCRAALACRICSTKEEGSHQKMSLTTYGQVVNYLFTAYAPQHINAEIEAEIMFSRIRKEDLKYII